MLNLWKAAETPVLLIPVENQVRELDAKLLLACVAAGRGLSSIIGFKRDMEFRIASFPRGIFLSKSLRIGKRKFFPLACKLGHKIIAWDEEALVHLPADMYYSRRLSAKGMNYLSHLFAWGAETRDVWQQYPFLPEGIPIHVVGNPRGDLLRPEIRVYYKAEADRIHNTYGDFILINTNFNHVNAFYPAQNLLQPPREPGAEQEFGQAARGMTRAYAEGFRDHKQSIFKDFQELIPFLDHAFPGVNIIVRPHPTENQEIYHRIAARCRKVKVTNEGNVVPWLMAAKVLVHNGCTTGVEAYAMRVPAVSFRKTVNDYYDDGFYQLPNRLSHQCFDVKDLQAMLEQILAGDMGAADGEERDKLVRHHLAAQEGPLASERIVDVLEKGVDELLHETHPNLNDRFYGWFKTTKRRVVQNFKAHLPGSIKTKEFQLHRYPALSQADIESKVVRFQKLLGKTMKPEIVQWSSNLFKIEASSR
jgi:surface carbohydrate biosynthesis protein